MKTEWGLKTHQFRVTLGKLKMRTQFLKSYKIPEGKEAQRREMSHLGRGSGTKT